MKKVLLAISIAVFVMSSLFANAQDVCPKTSKSKKEKAAKGKTIPATNNKKGKAATTVNAKTDKTPATGNQKVENAAAADGKKKWNAPANAVSVKNPVPPNTESTGDGKALYAKHCQSCHGKTGLGDGTKSSELKTEPGDFSKSSFQSQSDGSVFYKISEGRDDMPSFKKKISDANDLWNVVNYLRTLKK